MFRHGATHADQADTDPLNLANVAKQRQLNDAGRAKAKEIGEAFRKLQIPVGSVHTSMSTVRSRPASGSGSAPSRRASTISEGGQVVTPIENNRRTAAMRKLAATVPPPAPIPSS